VKAGKTLLFLSGMAFASSAPEQLSEKIQKNAIPVMNQFVQIMQDNSYKQSVEMVVPLMQKSLLQKSAEVLDDDTFRYQFKKAQGNARFYRYPVKITRIKKLKTTGIGDTNTYEKGTEYKFWIAKKEGVAGMPAPLVVFFKEGSSEAKLSYVGSL